MNDWIVVRHKKNIISDETEFCREEILHGVLACKVQLNFTPVNPSEKPLEARSHKSNLNI